MRILKKLQPGDKVAILSPSFGAPGTWPHVYQLGLERLRDVFNLEPIEFTTTKQINASVKDRAKDLVVAFENPYIKAVIASIGGDDQVTYIKNLPYEPFVQNPKPFFGFSDNTHFTNFLWLNNIPSYYGGALFTQFAMQGEMDEYTIRYLRYALFEDGEKELVANTEFNDIGLNWYDHGTLKKRRTYEPNDGWFWDGEKSAKGITWGGCLESIDDMLRHNIQLPTLEQFENVILITETSEEIPTPDYVFRVYRALGERGILERVKSVLIGRPKAWEFDKPFDHETKRIYRQEQRNAILKAVRQYNKDISIIQNMDFGHTDPQIAVPYGMNLRIDADKKKIFASF